MHESRSNIGTQALWHTKFVGAVACWSENHVGISSTYDTGFSKLIKIILNIKHT